MKTAIAGIAIIAAIVAGVWYLADRQAETAWKQRLQQVDVEIAKYSETENFDQWHALTEKRIQILAERFPDLASAALRKLTEAEEQHLLDQAVGR